MSIPENFYVEFQKTLINLDHAIEQEFPTSWHGRIVHPTSSQSSKTIEAFENVSATARTMLQNLERTQNETNKEEIQSKIHEIQTELGLILNKVLEITPKLRASNPPSSLQQFNRALKPLETLYERTLGIDELEKIAFNPDSPSKQEALQTWQENHRSLLTYESLATCPKEKVLHLTSLISHAGITNVIELPPYAQEYLTILKSTSSPAGKVRYIQTLFSESPELSHAAVAHLVNTGRLHITELFEGNPSTQELQETIENLAPYLRYLNCDKCPINSLPAALPNLQTIHCSYCPLLSAISSELPLLQTLSCSDCPLLSAISSELPLLQTLSCSECPLLSAISSELPLLKQLSCYGCDLLSDLPAALPNLQKLFCYECPLLSAIPPLLPNLQILTCSYCNLLSAIPSELRKLQHLDCSECPLLSAIPSELPNLKRLNCSYCPLLSSLPAVLPNLRTLHCLDSPIEVLPQVPLTATVHHGIRSVPNSPSHIEVDIDILTNNPKTYLIQLGSDFLLQNQPFPSLHYANSPGIDAGGLKRDFLTKIFQGLYHPSNRSRLPSVEGGQGVWPTSDGSKEIQSCYRTIGRLFYLCYRNVASLKIGEVFTPKLFDILKIAGFAEKAEEGLLSAFLLEKNLAPAINNLTSQKPLPSNFPANLYEIAASCMEPVPANPEEYFQLASNRQLFREHLLGLVQNNPFLQAALIIASELKTTMKPDEWTAFCSETTHTLMSKIQGELSKNLLKTSLSWHDRQYPTNSSKLQNTKALLEEWIEKASEEKLRAFLQATIGNCTLGPRDRVLINVYAGRGPSYIPTSHTCSFELELSADYQDFTVFEQSLKIYLEHALTGSGFQFG